MDKNILVSSGHTLIKALDRARIPPRVAMWVHNADTDTWKLWLVPSGSIHDRRDFYQRISEIVSKDRAAFDPIDANDTEMISATHPALQALGRLTKAPGLSGLAFAGNTLDGFHLPEAIILRMNL